MKKWDKWITLAPIALVLAFLPLVVGRINSKTYTENEPWLPANAGESDFFLYGKLFPVFLLPFYDCDFGSYALLAADSRDAKISSSTYIIWWFCNCIFSACKSSFSECAGDDRQYAGAFRNTFVSGCVLLQFFGGEKNRKYFHTDKNTWRLNWNPWRDWYFAVLWI